MQREGWRRAECPDAKECAPMAKILVSVAVAVVVLGAVAQLVVPGFVERHVESNLREDQEGGTATVDVKSFPVVRLLWGSGDRFEIRGRNLRLDLTRRSDDPLDRLDGFDEVDIQLEDVMAGPVSVQEFTLVRGEDEDSFYLRMGAQTTPQALAEAAGDQLGGSLGAAIGRVAGELLPDDGASQVPVSMSGEVKRPDGGGIDASGVDASVAGIPAGPFAEMMVQAVLERL